MRMLTAVVAAALYLTVAGCSGDPTPEPAPTSAAAPGAAVPPVLTGASMATADLTITSCPPGTGTVTASGTVTNPADTPADYLVVVTWLGADGGTLASAWSALPAVTSKGTVEWSTTGDLGDAQAAGCTTRLTRGTLTAP